jgi:hypothetical protein
VKRGLSDPNDGQAKAITFFGKFHLSTIKLTYACFYEDKRAGSKKDYFAVHTRSPSQSMP